MDANNDKAREQQNREFYEAVFGPDAPEPQPVGPDWYGDHIGFGLSRDHDEWPGLGSSIEQLPAGMDVSEVERHARVAFAKGVATRKAAAEDFARRFGADPLPPV